MFLSLQQVNMEKQNLLGPGLVSGYSISKNVKDLSRPSSQKVPQMSRTKGFWVSQQKCICPVVQSLWVESWWFHSHLWLRVKGANLAVFYGWEQHRCPRSPLLVTSSWLIKLFLCNWWKRNKHSAWVQSSLSCIHFYKTDINKSNFMPTTLTGMTLSPNLILLVSNFYARKILKID